MLQRFRNLIVGPLPEDGEEAQEEDYSPSLNHSESSDDQSNKPGYVMDMSESSWVAGIIPGCESPRFPYSRPDFLYLTTDDELSVSGDQLIRPVLVPKDPSKMPLYAGYAETINAGKTEQNEDQAAAKVLLVTSKFSSAVAADGSNSPITKDFSMRFLTEAVGGKSMVPSASDDDLLTVVSDDSSDKTDPENEVLKENAIYFGIFDGHAGVGAALMAANCLHEHIRERLSKVLESVVLLDKQEELLGLSSADARQARLVGSQWKDTSAAELAVKTMSGKTITRDCLVVGALETAFVEMDDQIQAEKLFWRISGGCAAIVAIFFMKRLYIANAGDCRALICCRGKIDQMSRDFTPASDTERKRIQQIASNHPELTGRHYTRLEYTRRLLKKDLTKKVLYRDWYMDGWSQKVVKESDLRDPLISDGPNKARLLGTIGVTRGFGDHHLVTVENTIPIKPFLSPVPEVKVFDIAGYDDDHSAALNDRDVLIIASDGLWDVTANEEAANIVNAALSQFPEDDHTKYTLAAQDLVAWSRGQHGTENIRGWQPSRAGGAASLDDITVFVVPLKYALSPPPVEDDEEMLQ